MTHIFLLFALWLVLLYRVGKWNWHGVFNSSRSGDSYEAGNGATIGPDNDLSLIVALEQFQQNVYQTTISIHTNTIRNTFTVSTNLPFHGLVKLVTINLDNDLSSIHHHISV